MQFETRNTIHWLIYFFFFKGVKSEWAGWAIICPLFGEPKSIENLVVVILWFPTYRIVGLHLFINLTFSQGYVIIWYYKRNFEVTKNKVNYRLRLLVSWKNPKDTLITLLYTIVKMFRPWFFRSYSMFDRDFLKKLKPFNFSCNRKYFEYVLYVMAIRVVEFWNGGYKIWKIFA